MTDQQLRESVVARCNFQMDACRTDLLDDGITCLPLIQHLDFVLNGGFDLELTMVKTGHHDDGPHGHFGGYAADGWPLIDRTNGDWLDQNDPKFQAFLERAASSPYLRQTGLAGAAYTAANMKAAGPTAFEDNGEDHVHLGAQ